MVNNTQYYIGYSTDKDIRYKAASGGIGVAFQKYLMSTKRYGTSITFRFNSNDCQYEPLMIHSADDVVNCGSIYQDIDLYNFLKDNLEKIKDGIILTCSPCQVKPIRLLLNKNNINNFIISFCCSGQTTIEGTWCLYKFLGINKNSVTNIQYRGNGWPSGIQISLNNGDFVYRDNYTDPWRLIHDTAFYRPKRCFYCKFDTSYESELSIADPWLKEYLENDKIGNTLILTNTELGKDVLLEMHNENLINYEVVDRCVYEIAQKPNIEKRNRVQNQKKYIKATLFIIENPKFRAFFTKSEKNMRLYLKLRDILYYTMIPSKRRFILGELWKRLCKKVRYYYYRGKVGSHNGAFNILGGVIMNNPQCVHLGENVGIGEKTYIGPVISYAGIDYQPSIEIGDGTWVGKNCSIACINRVEIGKDVLFAGHVHITDHSHGYEDINIPIGNQILISKGPVIIEDQCWLGFSCEILSGVHIGRHSIVAARAVVTRDVPAYSIVAGNPARVVKKYNKISKKWEKI